MDIPMAALEDDPMSRLILDFFKLPYVPVCSLTGSRLHRNFLDIHLPLSIYSVIVVYPPKINYNALL